MIGAAVILLIVILVSVLRKDKKEEAEPKKEKKKTETVVEEKTPVEISKEEVEFEQKQDFTFIRFYDVTNNRVAKDQYARFAKELKAFMDENSITSVTLDPKEIVNEGGSDTAAAANEVDVAVVNGSIADSFSFKFTDQNKKWYSCSYSVFDDEYTFAPVVEVKTGNDGVAEGDDAVKEGDAMGQIKVVMTETVEKTIQSEKLDRNKVISTARQIVNENGLLGYVTTVTVEKAEKVTEGPQTGMISLTGEMDDADNSAFSIDIFGKQYTGGLGL